MRPDVIASDRNRFTLLKLALFPSSPHRNDTVLRIAWQNGRHHEPLYSSPICGCTKFDCSLTQLKHKRRIARSGGRSSMHKFPCVRTAASMDFVSSDYIHRFAAAVDSAHMQQKVGGHVCQHYRLGWSKCHEQIK